MTSESFAQDWPGRGAWGQKGRAHHRHGPGGERPGGPAAWMFAGGPGRHRPPSPEEIEEMMEWRRMRGGPFGFGGRGRGGRGPGRHGRGRARRGDVRLAMLRLLAEEPANGYQLMQRIEQRSANLWRPSPGSVYPTLAQLEDEGLIRGSDGGGSRRFEITDAGREHLEARAQEPDPWDLDDDAGQDAITELGPLVIQIGKAAWQVASVADASQRARAVEVLRETRRSLYRILAEDPEADAAQDEGPAGPGDPGI